MTKEEIKDILLAFKEYDKKNPLSHCSTEHWESDDWDVYWELATRFIMRKLSKKESK